MNRQEHYQHEYHKILIIGNDINYRWGDFKEADLVIYLRDDFYEVVKPDDRLDSTIGQYDILFDKYQLLITKNVNGFSSTYNGLMLANFAIKIITPNTFCVSKNRFGPQGDYLIGQLGKLFDISKE